MFFQRTETATSGADKAVRTPTNNSFDSLSKSTGRHTPESIDAEMLILGDLDQAELTTRLDELQTTVDRISTKVEAQFVTISSHAEIAKRDNEFARGEASASSNRVRDELISLIEEVRALVIESTTAPTDAPSANAAVVDAAALERTLSLLNRRIDDIATRQLSMERRLAKLEHRTP